MISMYMKYINMYSTGHFVKKIRNLWIFSYQHSYQQVVQSLSTFTWGKVVENYVDRC